jgi:hypothetical protein
MPVIKKEKKGNIDIYHVSKVYDDAKMEKKLNTFVKKDDISLIINENADIYDETGKLLLKFRKNALNKKDHIHDFYENIIKFAKNTSSNRGNATGSKTRNTRDNPKVMSNIFGFFDRWSPSQKVLLRKLNKTLKFKLRECRFNMYHQEQYKKTIPLIQDIDKLYEKLTPEYYKKQKVKADQTHFKIPGTAFTTITTNVNYQTSIHTDKGDDVEGFGNLAVIEKGEYKGGETCFPQYGIGVNVRTGDILFMDVHQPHANLPIEKKTDDAIRLSIVCYLRKNVWLGSKGRSMKDFMAHNKTIRNLCKGD